MPKKTPVVLTLPEPCSQDWSAMQPQDAGRYCDHCRKTVVDFTQMTDRQVLAHVQHNGLGCGRFLDSQLSREISLPESRTFPAWGKAVAAGVSLLFGFQQKASAAIRATVPVEAVTTKEARPSGTAMPDSVQITGLVFDEIGEGLINWPVLLYHQDKIVATIYTNDDGEFATEKIPVAWLNDELWIRVKHGDVTRAEKITTPSVPVRITFVSESTNRVLVRVGGYSGAAVEQPVRHRRTFFRRLQFWRHE